MVNAVEKIRHLTMKVGYGGNKRTFRVLCEELSKTPHPTIVKVGANDGVSNDPCGDIVLAYKNWTGLLIEPVPYCFQKLLRNYGEGRFIFENIAIANETGERAFYYVSDEAAKRYKFASWVDGLGSFDKGHIQRHLDRRYLPGKEGALDPYIVETKVPVDTLANVIGRNGVKHISLLHIDAEGHDYEVLKSLRWKLWPVVILIEHEHLSDADREAMAGELMQGYEVLDCGSDYLAVRRGAME